MQFSLRADFVFFLCACQARVSEVLAESFRLMIRVFWSVGIVEMLPRLVTAFVKCTWSMCSSCQMSDSPLSYGLFEHLGEICWVVLVID